MSSSASKAWAGNRSGKLKILSSGPVWGRKEESIKRGVDTCTKSFWLGCFGYQDFGLGCKADSGCSFHTRGEYPNTWRERVTHFAEHKPVPQLDFGLH